jgi:hypothetical protein
VTDAWRKIKWSHYIPVVAMGTITDRGGGGAWEFLRDNISLRLEAAAHAWL